VRNTPAHQALGRRVDAAHRTPMADSNAHMLLVLWGHRTLHRWVVADRCLLAPSLVAPPATASVARWSPVSRDCRPLRLPRLRLPPKSGAGGDAGATTTALCASCAPLLSPPGGPSPLLLPTSVQLYPGAAVSVQARASGSSRSDGPNSSGPSNSDEGPIRQAPPAAPFFFFWSIAWAARRSRCTGDLWCSTRP